MSGSRGSSSSRPPLSTLVDAERSRPVDAERLRNATPPVSSTSAPTARPTGRARAPRPSARGFSTSWTAPALCDASSSSSPARSPPTWTRCGCSPALQSLTGRQLPLHSDGSATSSSYDASPRNLLSFLLAAPPPACRSLHPLTIERRGDSPEALVAQAQRSTTATAWSFQRAKAATAASTVLTTWWPQAGHKRNAAWMCSLTAL